MFCENCGKPVADGNKFCENCGKPVDWSKYSGDNVHLKGAGAPDIKGFMAGKSRILVMAVFFLLAFALSFFSYQKSHDDSSSRRRKDSASTVSTTTSHNTYTQSSQKADRTIMVYIVGSNLESEAGCASEDIDEMLAATLEDDTNIIIETGGSTYWYNSQIESGKVQRFAVKNNSLVELDNLGCTSMLTEDALTDFINFASSEYPADGYTLVLWDHGGGIPTSFGSDELFPGDSLSDVEIGNALRNSGVHFDAVVFDACNMCSLEIAMSIKDSADYMVAAESYVNGVGMYYTNWIMDADVNDNQIQDYCEKVVTDYMISLDNENLVGSMSVIRLNKIDSVYSAYASYMAEVGKFLSDNYADYSRARDNCGYSLGEDCVDIVTLATQFDNAYSKDLINATVNAVVYVDSDFETAHGLMVYSPYEYFDEYIYGRESLVSLGYSDGIINTYDNIGTMLYAYSGIYTSDSWYNSEYAEVYASSNYEITELEVTDMGTYFALELSDDDWDIVQSVQVNVIIDMGDNIGWVLGRDYWFECDENDNIIIEDPDSWTYISDSAPSYYADGRYSDTESGTWAEMGYVTCLVNGVDSLLEVYYDNTNPYGCVLGYIYADDYGTIAGEALRSFKDSDIINLGYDYIDLETGDSYYAYEDTNLSPSELEVSFADLDLSEYDTYVYYTVTDVYGRKYETELVHLTVN